MGWFDSLHGNICFMFTLQFRCPKYLDNHHLSMQHLKCVPVRNCRSCKLWAIRYVLRCVRSFERMADTVYYLNTLAYLRSIPVRKWSACLLDHFGYEDVALVCVSTKFVLRRLWPDFTTYVIFGLFGNLFHIPCNTLKRRWRSICCNRICNQGHKLNSRETLIIQLTITPCVNSHIKVLHNTMWMIT